MNEIQRKPFTEGCASNDQSLSVGDRVVVDRLYTGTVRYIGRVGTKKHNSLGIELDFSNGDNNGSRAGRVYFQCKPRHGIFREYKDVKKYVPVDYNQTGVINTIEIEEITSQKALSELLDDNVEIQRKMEQLAKENITLKEEIEKKDQRIKSLEGIIKHQAEHNITIEKEEKEKIHHQNQTNNSVIIDIVSEIISNIKEKIETENRIFNINNKA